MIKGVSMKFTIYKVTCMKFTIYKVTNLLNNKYYIGMHRTTNPNDGYLGSGVAIKKAIKKYGKEAFHISSYDDIKLYLSQYVHDGDLILTLGAGNVTKVADLLVSKNE